LINYNQLEQSVCVIVIIAHVIVTTVLVIAITHAHVIAITLI